MSERDVTLQGAGRVSRVIKTATGPYTCLFSTKKDNKERLLTRFIVSSLR